jgi:RNA polymerase sigma factor (TIGR02999 family)
MSSTHGSESAFDAEVTLVLREIAAGRDERRGQLLELLYEPLRGIAARHLAHERADHTLQATALVHEAWMKLVDQAVVPAGGRGHFLAVASQSMRRILVDHARGKRREKRGGNAERVSLEVVDEEARHDDRPQGGLDVLELDAALDELATRSERQARVVELRFFGGLTAPEIAAALEVSERTVERDWRIARAWLLARLGG